MTSNSETYFFCTKDKNYFTEDDIYLHGGHQIKIGFPNVFVKLWIKLKKYLKSL